jgi:hypothetical protein
VMALDPTRPAMIDGGDALRDASLPVYGNHYIEAELREYPDEAYTMKLAFARHKEPRAWAPWPLGDDRPLFLGECHHASGRSPSRFAQLQGEEACLGWTAARPGIGLLGKMLAEGYRWHGVAAFHFWTGTDRADLHYNSFQPVCVLCREWDRTFAGGQEVKRTLKVFNDTRFDSPIELRVKQSVGGNVVGQSSKTFVVPPGGTADYAYSFAAPQVSERTAGELVLTCERDGEEVFREVKPFHVIPPDGAAKPALTNEQLAVWDPKGVVKARLAKRGIPFTAVEEFEAIPVKARVVVVGPDALSPRQATDPRWRELAAGGKRVLVLDQDNPLRDAAIPAGLAPTDHAGRVAFPENLSHPAFAGLGAPDFSFWSGDHVVYLKAYHKSAREARSLVQCDEELTQTALAECPVKDGLLVLCQLVVGSKLDSDPVAQRLFDNLLNHCAAYSRPAKATVVVLPAGDGRLKLLDAAGLSYRKTADLKQALDDVATDIVVADASPAQLRVLSRSPDALKAFTGRGGWLMLWGLTPDGLADFNKLVGHDHVLRPFRRERVTLPAVRDPLLSGLTARDVVLLSNEKLVPHLDDRYPADDTLSYVVDLDDVAPFVQPPPQYLWAWAQMTNGFTRADGWQFVFYYNLGQGGDSPPQWSGKFSREEEITEFGIVLNTDYHVITKMRLLFDGRTDDAMTIDLKPAAELRQDFAVSPPRRCRSIALEPLAWGKVCEGDAIGVDNVWIKVRRSDEYRKTVVPLLNVGGLVKYRMGPGGVLLNQVRVLGAEANPINAEKKQTIVATLLRNLGADFGGERVAPGAGLAPAPTPVATLVTLVLPLGAILTLVVVAIRRAAVLARPAAAGGRLPDAVVEPAAGGEAQQHRHRV